VSVQTITFGPEQVPVLVIDNFLQEPERIIELAVDLAPFPRQEGHYYPGVRRRIIPQDGESFTYVDAVCKALAPLMYSTYGVSTYDIVDAGFSLITKRPDALTALQRIPHFDYPEDEGFAIIHYLSRQPGGGTAFYQHQRTGFERVTQERVEAYAHGREADLREFGLAQGYQSGDGNGFIELGMVEMRFNRAAIYPGSLLHSGVIPADFTFSPDPRLGRLTSNIFIRATS
jgi:Family of unknown function (DUF6445)